jgi:shikimate dehydrogenase
MEIPSAADFLRMLPILMADNLFRGANITIPHKETSLQLAAPLEVGKASVVLSPTVERVRAANTLFWNRPLGHWQLENTDVFGIKVSLDLLKSSLDLNPQDHYAAVVWGSGGAAKAAIHALTKDSQCTGIFCLSRGAPLETLKNVAYPSALPIPVWEQGDLSSHPESVLSLSTFAKAFQNFIGINATPLGMKSEMLPLGPFVLQNLFLAESKKGAFFDMLYLETPMQSLCRSHGVPYLNGDTMLKEQAKKSFQLWTGELPD